MNIDKLKALAEQTELLQERDGRKYIDNIDGLEQFAQLLIAECVNLCDDNSEYHIKKHFGLTQE